MKRSARWSAPILMVLLALLTFPAALDAQRPKNCIRGKPRGNTCITQNKTCRGGPGQFGRRTLARPPGLPFPRDRFGTVPLDGTVGADHAPSPGGQWARSNTRGTRKCYCSNGFLDRVRPRGRCRKRIGCKVFDPSGTYKESCARTPEEHHDGRRPKSAAYGSLKEGSPD